ncbi:hypothetical protein J2N86_14055 (plasmid) [Legionella lytica]|uniref:Uncharacterized protein n=1 Tax=Legionella lytica TaxID=96232 RepID=A0ABY4YCP0_9GAMM|nr:hypothetical protein [Legionella lytica]USQ15370.1 hypothetical protein J2N86_14055 [Legionella lytica]
MTQLFKHYPIPSLLSLLLDYERWHLIIILLEKQLINSNLLENIRKINSSNDFMVLDLLVNDLYNLNQQDSEDLSSSFKSSYSPIFFNAENSNPLKRKKDKYNNEISEEAEEQQNIKRKR